MYPLTGTGLFKALYNQFLSWWKPLFLCRLFTKDKLESCLPFREMNMKSKALAIIWISLKVAKLVLLPNLRLLLHKYLYSLDRRMVVFLAVWVCVYFFTLCYSKKRCLQKLWACTVMTSILLCFCFVSFNFGRGHKNILHLQGQNEP